MSPAEARLRLSLSADRLASLQGYPYLALASWIPPAQVAMDVADHLSRVPLFKELAEDDVQRLAALTRPISFPGGANVVELGEAGHSLFLIIEGQVRVIYPTRSSDFELARLGPGDFFGEMALLNDKPRAATVQTLDDVSLLVLKKADFRDIVLQSPDVALRLLEALSVRIRTADEHISTLSDKAMKDPLTGLLNRRSFDERIKEEIDRAIRYDEKFAIILVDIDRFKSVNDNFGHDVGDVVLSWIGRLLGEHTRAADTPFRIGGEEFAVLAPATAAETTHMVTQRLVDVVAEARPPVDFNMQVTMSAGYAACPEHGASADQLFHIADRALLRAKEEGRNRVSRPTTDDALPV